MIRSHTEFLQIAFKAYDNPKIISLSEFEADIKRFSYLNVIAGRYLEDNDELKLRLAVNHAVIIYNCFGTITPDLIKYKTAPENCKVVETVMYFLKMIERSDSLDMNILTKLENL